MKRILGLLGWLGVVLVLAAVAIRFTRPELQQWSQGLAIAGLVVTALYGLSQWRDIARSFQGRNVRYGSLAVGSSVLFLAILVGINYVSNRQHKVWDLTAAQQFSLSDQTKQIVAGLKKPLKVKVFYGGESYPVADPFRDRLSGFENLSKMISVEYINAERDPIPAQQAGIQQYGTIVFEYEGRTEKITSRDEQALTNALKKLTEGKATKAYIVQGHGEHDMAGSDPRGYSAVVGRLQNDNFEVAKLTLAQEGKVPDDATVVIIAGAKLDYLPLEVDALRAFLKRGGKLLLMIDPPEKPDAPEPVSLIALAKEWGIDVGNNLVVDTSGLGRQFGTNEAVPLAIVAPSGHPITDKFPYMTGYPLARSATPIEGGANGHTAQKLVETSPKSWAETDLKGLFAKTAVEMNLDKGDKAGPISLGAAVSAPAPDAPAPATPELPKPETRLVVMGDSDFVSNGALGLQGNRPFFLNIMNWLAQQENMIAIRQKDPEDRRITLTQDQGDRIFWLTMVIIPGLLLANGVRVWWRRR